MTPFAKLLSIPTLFVAAVSASALVRVVDVNPGRDAACPGTFQMEDANGVKVCSRSTVPSTALIIDVMALMVANANIKGLRNYHRLTGTLKAYQSGGTEAFAAGLRDSSSIDSSNYVDGISITKGSPRQHIFTLAVGLSYDQDLFMAGMCPCGASTRTLHCGGTAAPSWLPLSEMVCDSGTLGSPAAGWRTREMEVSIDMVVTSSTDSLEIRLMADQGTSNENLGIAELYLDIHETQDLLPPVLTLLGSSTVRLSVGDVYVESGAQCLDNIDGVVTPIINGSVDTSVAGIGTHTVSYICVDARENIVTAERIVTVMDNYPPLIHITGEIQQCVVRGRAYVEYGAICSDVVDGSYAASLAGEVDASYLGMYTITYTCTDVAGNTAVANRSVLVISNALPGRIVVENFQLQTSQSGNLTTAGARTTISNVSPLSDFRIYWSKNITLNAEGCRYLSIQEWAGGGWQTIQRYESSILLTASESISSSDAQLLLISQGLNASLSRGLRDSTSYRIAVDEHFLQEKVEAITSTQNTSEEVDVAGVGSLRQHLLFTTGDYSGPVVVTSEPEPLMTSWPQSQPIVLTFNELVQAGMDTAFLNIQHIESGEAKSLPCNGSEGRVVLVNSLQETFMPHIGFNGQNATLRMDTWPAWQPCSDYRVDVDEGCFSDVSVNSNPSKSFMGYRFVTSCVVGLSPDNESLNVPAASTVVLTFADNVQAGLGEIYFTSPGQDALAINASSYPMVFINNATVTVDLACRTKTCALNAIRYPQVFADFNTSDGLCANRDISRCRGNPLRVQIGIGAFQRVDGQWPVNSLLNGTDVLPSQLLKDEYSFVVRPFDLTPPVFESVYAAATGDTSIKATVRIDENGTVYCAALGGTDGDPCSSVTVLRDDSNDRCSNVTYPDEDCDGCESPGYGCFNKTAIWADDGCSGKFMVDGVELDCASRLSDLSVYDGGGRSILDLGYRHACAIRKVEQDVTCWGEASGIDPVTGVPLPGTFLSVSAGHRHTCGVKKDTKQVACWGLDLFGETSPPNAPGVTYKAVTCGHRFTCALRSDNGEAVCWGLNDKGQASPPSGVSFWAISAGHLHVCGIVTTLNFLDSYVTCWGSNEKGQSSPPANVPFMSITPESNVLYEATISAGEYHTCAIRADTAAVQCWGSDSDGQSTVPDLTGVPIIEVAAGYAHTCVVHKALPGTSGVDGTVQCWGRNDYSQATPPAGQNFVSIDAAADYTCGVTLAETVLCWGINFQSQAQPPVGTFGVLDQYSNATCTVDTSATRERIYGPHDTWNAGALSRAEYSTAVGFAEVELSLSGLRQNTTYQVYCYAEDDELPLPNVVTNRQMTSTHRVVTTLDRVPPSMLVLQIYSSTDDTVTVVVQLNEPGVVYCIAVRDNEPAPTIREIPAFGSHNTTGENLVASVVISNLARDTEYDTYCTSHDNASWNPDAKRVDNWATYEAALHTKRDIHTLYDTTPPTITGLAPPNGDFVTCRIGNLYAGCATKVSLSFSEDIQRGEGNITFVCQNNFAVCTEVTIPMESPFFDLGTTFIENTRLDLSFDKPLADMTTYKVVIGSGAVQDMSGNHFAMDVQCPLWFDPQWQQFLGPCTPVYTLQIPS